MSEAAITLAVVLLLTTLAAAAQDASGPSIWNGVFTAAQAKRGNDAYQASCSGCHGSDLHATDPEAVDLTGPGIRARWNGKTLNERFETIRDRMPPGNANTLGDKTYMDILAFILESNDFPAGNQELVPDTAMSMGTDTTDVVFKVRDETKNMPGTARLLTAGRGVTGIEKGR